MVRNYVHRPLVKYDDIEFNESHSMSKFVRALLGLL